MSAQPSESLPDAAPALARMLSRGPATGAWFVALLGWTALMCFYDLGGGARFEPIDCWVAQTAREMLDAHDWLVPRFSGETRMQKSPGPYWAVMATSLLRGTPVDEVSARIPNALAALALVATIFWLTRRIAGDRAAIFAGFAASSSMLVLWWSHRGASDLGLTTFTTASLACLWIAAETESPGMRRNVLFLAGFFAAGLGMLWKMPMPLAVVGAPVFFYLLLRKRWSVLANPWHLLGLVLFLLPWLPWALMVGYVEDAALAKWKVEFLDRFTGDLPNVKDQKKWWYYFSYLGPTALYCLPFTLSLPGALARAVRRRPGVNREGTLFMLIWFASLLAFFTASTGKEWRYFLPALPPLLVLLGIELAAFFDPQRRVAPRRTRTVAIILWCTLPSALIGGGFVLRAWFAFRGGAELAGWRDWGDVLWAYAVAAAIVVTGLSLAAWLYLRQRRYASFGLIVATMWVMWLWVWPNVMPLVMSQRAFIDFAQQLANPATLPSEQRPCLEQVGTQDSRIIWYSNLRFPRVIDQLALLKEQKGHRSLDYEIRRYGEEMVNRLERDEPVLFVAAFEDYCRFLYLAPGELAQKGRVMPRHYLWLQSRYGREDVHFVLFGNKPPPFPSPELRAPEKLRAKLVAAGALSTGGSGPPTSSAAAPPKGRE